MYLVTIISLCEVYPPVHHVKEIWELLDPTVFLHCLKIRDQ